MYRIGHSAFMLGGIKRYSRRFWDFAVGAGTLIGIIYAPADLFGLTETYPWLEDIAAMVDRFTILVTFSTILVLYILWIDVRPYVRRFLESKSKLLEDPIAKFVRNRENFTLAEAACLLTKTEIVQSDPRGVASGVLHDLKQMILRNELECINVSEYELLMSDPNSLIKTLSGNESRNLRDDLEISKDSLARVAEEMEVKIPGLN